MLLARLGRARLQGIHGKYILLQNFAAGRNILRATKTLIDMDSTLLDNTCREVLTNYMRLSPDTLDDNKKKNEEENTETIENSIKYLYNCASDAGVGILKGDIHS
jgi:hypothetical protein